VRQSRVRVRRRERKREREREFIEERDKERKGIFCGMGVRKFMWKMLKLVYDLFNN
jgi:hypothetical protein